MKKWFFVPLAALALCSCEKEHGLDNDFIVLTNYDSKANFIGHETFFIPDSILFIGYGQEADYVKGTTADAIIKTYVENMENMGYVRTDQKKKADLGIQLTLIDDTQHFVGYTSPYWWLDYPGYWPVYYWGNWGYWNYSFPIHYSYSVGSLLTDMVDLKARQGKEEKLPVIWNSYVSGLLSGSKYIDTSLTIRGINQSFKQAEYLKKQ